MAILDGKRVLITGGSRGLGRALVKTFADEGARVAFSYVNDVAGGAAAGGGGGRGGRRGGGGRGAGLDVLPSVGARRCRYRRDDRERRARVGRPRHPRQQRR